MKEEGGVEGGGLGGVSRLYSILVDIALIYLIYDIEERAETLCTYMVHIYIYIYIHN